MPTPDIASVPSFADYETFKRTFNQAVQKMNNLLVQLDTLNIAELNASVIIAGTVTADKMNVNELSAISANLGTITAGEVNSILMQASTIIGTLMRASTIIGSYIATRDNGEFPRAEMSNTQNLFGVYSTATRFIQMAEVAGFLYMKFRYDNSAEIDINSVSSGLSIQGFGNFSVAVPLGSIQLTANAVTVPSWSTFYNNSTSQSLQDALNSINSNISSLFGLYASLDARVTALENA